MRSDSIQLGCVTSLSERLRTSPLKALAVFLAIFAVAMSGQRAIACPFCAAVSPSLTDRLKVARFAVVARMVGNPHPESVHIREIEFAPVRFLKGDVAEFGAQQIMAPIPQFPDAAAHFLTMGANEAELEGSQRLVWSLPVQISDVAADYIVALADSPTPGPERLAYFIPYLNHADPLIAQDAYDEFGAAPYDDVKAVAAQLPREDLKRWIADLSIPANSRRLYLTLLGVCGHAEDAEFLLPMVEQSIANAEPDSSLDAMIACFLTLSGTSGLPAINQLLLANEETSLGDLQSTVLALRFHGEEETKIERTELMKSLRLVLDRPAAADIVIRDLARWEDWSVLERLVTLFRDSTGENAFLRVPIVKYLQACPLPEAATALEQITQEFPQVVARANVLPFELGQRRTSGTGRPAKTSQSSGQGETPGSTSTDLDKPDTNGTDAEADQQADISQDPAAEALPIDDLSPTASQPKSPGIFTNAIAGLVIAGIGLLSVLLICLILRRG